MGWHVNRTQGLKRRTSSQFFYHMQKKLFEQVFRYHGYTDDSACFHSLVTKLISPSAHQQMNSHLVLYLTRNHQERTNGIEQATRTSMDIQGAQYPLSWFLDSFGKTNIP